MYTLMILSIWTDRCGQTMQTQIRLFLMKVYTVCHSAEHLLDTLLYVKTTLLKFQDNYSIFFDVRIFQIFAVTSHSRFLVTSCLCSLHTAKDRFSHDVAHNIQNSDRESDHHLKATFKFSLIQHLSNTLVAS